MFNDERKHPTVGSLRAASESDKTKRTLHAVPQRRNGDCDPHEAQIDIPVNLPRTSFALHCRVEAGSTNQRSTISQVKTEN